MSTDEKFKQSIGARLKKVARLSLRPYFGGTAICRGDVQFGMIMGKSVYLRVDHSSRAKYEQKDSQPFSYSTKRGRVYVRTYYEIPENILKSTAKLKEWLDESIAIARKIKLAKIEKSRKGKIR